MESSVYIIEEETQITQDWKFLDIVTKRIPPSWEKVFADALPEFKDLALLLDGEPIYFPLKKDIFRAFRLCPLDRIKVCIIGQDPYPQWKRVGEHSLPRAQGLAFSVAKDDEIPISLRNIFIELTKSTGIPTPSNGDLTPWAIQGVLLLNMALTVTPEKPNSHAHIWDGFIKKVLAEVIKINPKTIFVLWGREAQKKIWDSRYPMIPKESIVILGAHPSARGGQFFGGNYFNKINLELLKQNKPLINWRLE